MSEKFVTILVMGVAGSGKTTIAKLLSKKINAFLIEADDYHSKNNIDKMSAGIPLDDDDRYDWLIKIKEEIDKRKSFQNLVVACSALKEIYRQRLVKGIVAKIDWFCLKGTFDLIEKRLDKRGGHYFKSTLLKSQFDTIEYPDYCTFIDIIESPEKIVERIKSAL